MQRSPILQVEKFRQGFHGHRGRAGKRFASAKVDLNITAIKSEELVSCTACAAAPPLPNVSGHDWVGAFLTKASAAAAQSAVPLNVTMSKDAKVPVGQRLRV